MICDRCYHWEKICNPDSSAECCGGMDDKCRCKYWRMTYKVGDDYLIYNHQYLHTKRLGWFCACGAAVFEGEALASREKELKAFEIEIDKNKNKRDFVQSCYKDRGDYRYGKWSVFVVNGEKLPTFGLKKKYQQMLSADHSYIWDGCISKFIKKDGTIHGCFITGIPRLDEFEIAESFSSLAAAAPFLSFDCQVYRDTYHGTIERVMSNNSPLPPILQFKVEGGKFGFVDVGKRIYVHQKFDEMINRSPGGMFHDRRVCSSQCNFHRKDEW